MVSIISGWLQKKMPSYGEIESKVTKEQIEDNKDIIHTLKSNIVLFIFLFGLLYMDINIFMSNKFVISFIVLTIVIDGISILFSIIFSSSFSILKYKIYLLMIFIPLFMLQCIFFVTIVSDTENLVMKIILILIIVLSIRIILLKNIIKTTKYDSLIKYGSVFCLLTLVLEFLFGKADLNSLIEPIISIITFALIFKIGLNAATSHFKTLFYVLTYPEEFRKKFGYSVKEWYGKRSPQYREEKKFNQ